MELLDEITPLNLYFVRQNLPKSDIYEIYRNGKRIYNVRNKYDTALKEWCKVVSGTQVK